MTDDTLLDAAKNLLVRSWREFGGDNWDEKDYYDSAVLRLLRVVQATDPDFDPSVDESSPDKE